jgi:hypothetical protein
MSALMNETAQDVLLELLQSAIQAPSSHNTQPWIFKISGNVIDLYADRTRALPVNDPDDRELTISCGCALMNVRIAAAASGYLANVAPFPDVLEPDLLARISIVKAASALDAGLLEPFITQRRTYRARFAEKTISEEIKQSLLDAVSSEQCDLHILKDVQACYAATDLVSEADSMQWNNPSWRRELAAWMHPRRRGDGLLTSTLAAPVTQLIIRSFDMGNGVAAKDRELADGSPILAILSTALDSPKEWLKAGQALERLLLTAVQHGLQASYLNQAIQVPSLRNKLRHLLQRPQFPQILLRLGYPVDTQPAPSRRPLHDVIVDS